MCFFQDNEPSTNEDTTDIGSIIDPSNQAIVNKASCAENDDIIPLEESYSSNEKFNKEEKLTSCECDSVELTPIESEIDLLELTSCGSNSLELCPSEGEAAVGKLSEGSDKNPPNDTDCNKSSECAEDSEIKQGLSEELSQQHINVVKDPLDSVVNKLGCDVKTVVDDELKLNDSDLSEIQSSNELVQRTGSVERNVFDAFPVEEVKCTSKLRTETSSMSEDGITEESMNKNQCEIKQAPNVTPECLSTFEKFLSHKQDSSNEKISDSKKKGSCKPKRRPIFKAFSKSNKPRQTLNGKETISKLSPVKSKESEILKKARQKYPYLKELRVSLNADEMKVSKPSRTIQRNFIAKSKSRNSIAFSSISRITKKNVDKDEISKESVKSLKRRNRQEDRVECGAKESQSNEQKSVNENPYSNDKSSDSLQNNESSNEICKNSVSSDSSSEHHDLLLAEHPSNDSKNKQCLKKRKDKTCSTVVKSVPPGLSVSELDGMESAKSDVQDVSSDSVIAKDVKADKLKHGKTFAVMKKYPERSCKMRLKETVNKQIDIETKSCVKSAPLRTSKTNSGHSEQKDSSTKEIGQNNVKTKKKRKRKVKPWSWGNEKKKYKPKPKIDSLNTEKKNDSACKPHTKAEEDHAVENKLPSGEFMDNDDTHAMSEVKSPEVDDIQIACSDENKNVTFIQCEHSEIMDLNLSVNDANEDHAADEVPPNNIVDFAKSSKSTGKKSKKKGRSKKKSTAVNKADESDYKGDVNIGDEFENPASSSGLEIQNNESHGNAVNNQLEVSDHDDNFPHVSPDSGIQSLAGSPAGNESPNSIASLTISNSDHLGSASVQSCGKSVTCSKPVPQKGGLSQPLVSQNGIVSSVLCAVASASVSSTSVTTSHKSSTETITVFSESGSILSVAASITSNSILDCDKLTTSANLLNCSSIDSQFLSANTNSLLDSTKDACVRSFSPSKKKNRAKFLQLHKSSTLLQKGRLPTEEEKEQRLEDKFDYLNKTTCSSKQVCDLVAAQSVSCSEKHIENMSRNDKLAEIKDISVTDKTDRAKLKKDDVPKLAESTPTTESAASSKSVNEHSNHKKSSSKKKHKRHKHSRRKSHHESEKEKISDEKIEDCQQESIQNIDDAEHDNETQNDSTDKQAQPVVQDSIIPSDVSQKNSVMPVSDSELEMLERTQTNIDTNICDSNLQDNYAEEKQVLSVSESNRQSESDTVIEPIDMLKHADNCDDVNDTNENLIEAHFDNAADILDQPKIQEALPENSQSVNIEDNLTVKGKSKKKKRGKKRHFGMNKNHAIPAKVKKIDPSNDSNGASTDVTTTRWETITFTPMSVPVSNQKHGSSDPDIDSIEHVVNSDNDADAQLPQPLEGTEKNVIAILSNNKLDGDKDLNSGSENAESSIDLISDCVITDFNHHSKNSDNGISSFDSAGPSSIASDKVLSPQNSETIIPFKRGPGRPPGSKHKKRKLLTLQKYKNKMISKVKGKIGHQPSFKKYQELMKVKRGRGRPKGSKNKVKPQTISQGVESNSCMISDGLKNQIVNSSPPIKRPRGRPKGALSKTKKSDILPKPQREIEKKPQTSEFTTPMMQWRESSVISGLEGETKKKRGPGRPRKKPLPVDVQPNISSSVKHASSTTISEPSIQNCTTVKDVVADSDRIVPVASDTYQEFSGSIPDEGKLAHKAKSKKIKKVKSSHSEQKLRPYLDHTEHILSPPRMCHDHEPEVNNEFGGREPAQSVSSLDSDTSGGGSSLGAKTSAIQMWMEISKHKRKKNKKKLIHFRSKHKNIIDPVFIAEVDFLTTLFPRLSISPRGETYLKVRPGEVPLPSIFKIARIDVKKKKKDKLFVFEKAKPLKPKNDSELSTKDRIKLGRKISMLGVNFLDFEDLNNSQQCNLPPKKRHKLFSPLGGQEGPTDGHTKSEKRKVGRPRKVRPPSPQSGFSFGKWCVNYVLII